MRSAQQIRRHYEVEVALADRLRKAPATERRRLYSQVYDTLFQNVPDHPMLNAKNSGRERQAEVEREVALLKRFLPPGGTYLEIGPGDCRVAFAMCEYAKRVFGVDVSAEITSATATPENFELALSDGTSIPVPEGCVDLAYSNQLFEHLHVDDALEQLRNVRRTLPPGGRYLCITPNRLSGPHDISGAFDEVARGLHMKEYTATELAAIFRSEGFARCDVIVGRGTKFVILPIGIFGLFEATVARLPKALRQNALVQKLLGVKLLAKVTE